MTQEEVKIKVTADISQATADVSKMRDHVNAAGASAHSSFIHASSGGKEFKKLMHELMNESPALGMALKAAISPIAAAFLAAGAAASWFSKQIEEVNKKLDEARDRNFATFGDPKAGKNAAASRSKSISEMLRAFAESQKSGLMDRVNTGKEMLSELVTSEPSKTEIQRKFLQGERLRLNNLRGIATWDKDQAVSAAGNPATQSVIARAKEQLAKLKTEMAPLEKEEAELVERARSGGVSDWRMWLATRFPMQFGSLMGGGIDINNNGSEDIEKLKRLKEYRETIEHTEKSLERATHEDEKNTEALKDKLKTIGDLNTAIKDIDKQLFKMGPSMSSMPVPAIDPETGGITYRPLKDSGGISYRPLRGATVGLSAPKPLSQEKVADEVLKLVLDYLRTGGIPVTGKD